MCMDVCYLMSMMTMHLTLKELLFNFMHLLNVLVFIINILFAYELLQLDDFLISTLSLVG